MKFCKQITYTLGSLLLLTMALCAQSAYGQEDPADFRIKSPFHNQLFFNRFLINPTFSLVRENKSYLNILHRNQYASFEDNIQNYYLGFSNKLNERTALGIGLYGQWEGVMQEFG
ncbi:MAG: type IX secretion system membrane protein PorP/SprF, partial [Robiginitalea sp.]